MHKLNIELLATMYPALYFFTGSAALLCRKTAINMATTNSKSKPCIIPPCPRRQLHSTGAGGAAPQQRTAAATLQLSAGVSPSSAEAYG